jgi:hypothetical protein
MDERKSTSSHILNASSNLLGICFIVLTSLKLLKLEDKTLVDEFTIVAMFLFMLAAIFSFLGLRSSRDNHRKKLEDIADFSFLIGLISLFGTAVLITFNVMQ